MMITSELVITGLFIACTAMSALWILQLFTKDAGVVDFGWAALIGTLSVYGALQSDAPVINRIVGGLFGGVWGFRLAIHILFDRIIGKHEDGRYQAMRAHFGKNANLFFLGFFLFQALLAVGFAVPFLMISTLEFVPSTLQLGLAGVLWLVSIGGEALADAQLSRWRRNPENKGKTCRSGLWRYSRHPNYFFEWLHWWAYAIVTFGSPWWFVTVIVPLVMLLFLFRVTGIPYTELQALKSRGDDYREYQRTTSVFIPLPPKKVS